MTKTRQLARSDVMFVAGETPNIYQHVAGLTILDNSDCPDFDFDHFRQHCIERASLIPHLRWKLHSVPLGLDRPYWVEDENFSFDNHIKHIALPAPGDEHTLCEVASHLYSKHLDRSKPLWEMWLIEGLEGGRYAYLQKFHHCMMDGEGAFKMIEVICDFEPKPSGKKQIDKSISEAKAGQAPTYSERSTKALQHLARLPGDAARSAYDIIKPKVLEQLERPRIPWQDTPTVPLTCFNGEISSDRAMNLASLPMADIKTIKNHFEVSLNDVILAVVSSAVRSYLLEHAELPDESLRTSIPVSLRTENDDQLSNKVTNTTITLATDIADPKKRLLAIHLDSEQAKVQAHSGATGMIELFQMMPPIMVSTLMGSLSGEQAPQMLGANLIVSNVRGSPIPMYIAGARMEKMYPMSILTAGMGLNITCISYLGEMDFGIVAEPHLIPDHDSIPERLKIALSEYLALCKPRRKSTRRPAAKPKTKAKAKKKPAPKKAARKKAPARKKTAQKKAATTRRKSGSGAKGK